MRREMGRVYQWEEADGEDVQDTKLDAGQGAGVGEKEESVGEEGTAVINGNSKKEDDAASGPPTWNEIGITSGCNQAFFGIMLTLCEKGDRVLIPVPWVRSLDLIHFASARMVELMGVLLLAVSSRSSISTC